MQPSLAAAGAPTPMPGSFTAGGVIGDISVIPDFGTYPTGQGLRASGITMDTAGNLFVADTGNHVVHKINVDIIWTVVAGTVGTAGSTGDGDAATNAFLNGPWDVATDTIGNLYIADTGNNAIRKVDQNNVMTTIIGLWNNNYLGTTGPLKSPISIDTDTTGSLYIGDTLNFRILKLSQKTGRFHSIIQFIIMQYT